jgi:hypothetical protein
LIERCTLQETTNDKPLAVSKAEDKDQQNLEELYEQDQASSEHQQQQQQEQPVQQQQEPHQRQFERQASADSAEEGFQASLSALVYLLTNHEDRYSAVAAALNAVLSVPRRQACHNPPPFQPTLHTPLIAAALRQMTCICMRMRKIKEY